MKQLVVLFIFSLIFTSCKYDTNCKNDEFLMGRYKLQTTLITSYNNNDSTVLSLAKKNNWNKVILIVEKNKYHFEDCEEYFRKYEGSWRYRSIGFDGDCYLFIEQKEGSINIPLDPFNIAIKFNDKVIILPFKKE